MSDRDVPVVESLYIAPTASAPMISVDSVDAVAHRGLLSDRYLLGRGYYSNQSGWGANVTLIRSEAIEAINVGHQTTFTPDLLRRNIVTKHLKLDALVGREFRCGDTVLRGTKPYPPCAHLAYLIGDHNILRYLAYCGGIGAEVIQGGTIRIGDRIEIDWADA